MPVNHAPIFSVDDFVTPDDWTHRGPVRAMDCGEIASAVENLLEQLFHFSVSPAFASAMNLKIRAIF
jgi:hypothetical protein